MDAGAAKARIGVPHRVLVAGSAQPAWYDATDARRRAVLDQLQRLFEKWDGAGARCAATFNDEFFTVGPPAPGFFSFCLTLDVPSADSLAGMLQQLRESVDGVRLDTYIRMEAKIGEKLGAIVALPAAWDTA